MAITEQLPNLSAIGLSPSSIFTFFIWLIAFVLFLIVSGILLFFFLRRLRFNKHIVIFKKVSGRLEPVLRDKAMELKLERGGEDTVFYTRKSKTYIPTPKIQTGRNTFWFVIGEDGQWVNVGLQDFDKQKRKLKLHFLDTDMRYANVGIRKDFQTRYRKVSFWDKYGGLIVWTIYILVTAIAVFLWFDKLADLTNAANAGTNAVLDSADRVLTKLEKVLAATENVCATSGVRAA